MSLIIRVITLIILLFLSAFFSGAETAMTMSSPVKIRTLAEQGNKRAALLLKVINNRNKMLSCILIGNNLVNISASSISATVAMELWGSIGVSIATALLTLLVLIFGEITPKTLAAHDPESPALNIAPVIYLLMIILTPVIKLVDGLSGGLLGLLKIDISGKASPMTERELRTYVDVGHEDGAIEADEKKMLFKVFDFSDGAVKNIMIPRIDFTSVPREATYGEMMELFRDSLYTRFPVYDDKPENIIGIVNLKDLIFASKKEGLTAGDIAREAHFTHENKKTSDLLEEMRINSFSMTFILDEYGSCVGMVTMEDLLEELVGDIRDEYDDDEKELIKPIGNNRYLIDGSVKLDDVNEALNANLASNDFDSIGGVLVGALDRLPRRGEGITIEQEAFNISVRALRVSEKRVERVLLEIV